MLNGPYVPTEKEREEIEQCLQKFDADDDGRISNDEIQDFLRKHGKWFSGFRAGRAISANDFNKNGVLDTPQEISAFVKYAKDHWKKTYAAATPRTRPPKPLPISVA